MAKFDPSVAKTCEWKKVAAGVTTAPLSTPGDGVPGRDYLERLVVTAASTLTGTVTLFDGDTTLLLQNAQVTAYVGNNVNTYELGILAQTTEGFNVTTGSSVSVLAVGRFSG